ncbi:MAG: O-antigen ligase family protein [Verrucomicrobia subdivision 3 bacterium]|nr:O-antigen ligase family protein [Limisphaerales bacterium]
MALCLIVGVVWFGAVTVDVAAPAFAFAVLLGLLWAGKLFFMRVVSWKSSPMHWPVLAFTAYAVIRYFASPIEYDSRMELFNVLLLAFVYFVCAFNFYRSRDRNILLIALLALTLGEAIYGLWQFGTKSDAVLNELRPLSYRGRASGTYFCPNHLAGLLEIVICLAIGRIAVQRFSRKSVEKSALQKIVILYITLFLITCLIVTLSRSSWASLAVALATLFFWGDWDWRVMWPRLAVAFAAVCAIGLLVYNITPVRIYVQETLSGEQAKDGSAFRDPSFGGRTLMWGATAGMIKDYPALGTGPGTWQWFHPKYRPQELQAHPEHAHNDILQLASDYGLIGFGIVVWAFVAFYRHAGLLARRNTSSEQRSFAVGSALAVTATLVHSWFDFNMHILANALLLVTLMGFTVAMDDSGERYKRQELPRLPRFALGLAILALCAGAIWFVRPAALAFSYTTEGDDSKDILQWDRALALYNTAMRFDPKLPDAYYKAGQVAASKARWRIGPDKAEERKQLAREAVGYFERAVALNPFHTFAIIRLGQAYEMAGDFEAAARCFKRAIELEPTSAYVYEQMGLFSRRTGDEAAALEAFEKSRKLRWDIVAELNILDLKAPQ